MSQWGLNLDHGIDMNANTAFAEYRESVVAQPAISFEAFAVAEAHKPKISANSFRDLTARLKRPAAAVVVTQPQVIPAFAQPLQVAPAIAVAEPAIEVVHVELSTELDFAPSSPPVAPHISVTTVAKSIEIPWPEALPSLAEPVQELPVAEIAETIAAPQEELAFEPTLVGADIPVEIEVAATDSDVEINIKEELEKRRTELELESIWRNLLAKPTAEDLAQYLREVGEFTRQEGGMSLPVAADFDLATIQPASEFGDSAAKPVFTTPAEPLREFFESEPEINLESAALIAAAEASGFENAELARSLLDMMATGNSSGLPHERALAADTLLRLLPKLELKPLVMLAERLAMMDNPPHLLVARLIRDPRVEVAGPLLENCMHITDRDLQMVTEEPELSKLRMIARRRKLSRAISDVLIKTGETSVLLTLVRNMEADISHEGFNALIAHVDEHPDLLAPLATRPDFTAPFAFELFWHAPAPMRRYILSRFLTDSETLGKILKITLATKDVEEHDDQSSGDFVIMEALDRAARGRRDEASEELASAIRIAPDTALRILNDPEGEPLIIMLKAAGYPRNAIRGLLQRMSDAELPIISRLRDLDDLQSIFETMSFTKARILLTYWDWAMCKSGPYAPVH
jgi:uncharacterized protein (DUF2336 family)